MRIALLIACVGSLCLSARAEYAPLALQSVPIERLIENLERLVGEKPADVQLRINLARVHAMAFALKTNRAEIRRGREQDGAWTGHGPAYAQFEVRKPRDAAAAKVAEAHLEKAVARYRESVALAPDNTVAQLGLGWCLMQAGRTAEAIESLRRVVELSWPADRRGPTLLMGQRSVTEEASSYLLPLLDPDRDGAEIATLRARVATLEKQPRAITPVAIPVRDGLRAEDITDESARVLFDADGSGRPRRWTWITPDAAWLVYDQRGSRRIDSALQMFGSVTFWLFWQNGYDAMRSLDDDGDGRLAGGELEHLGLWRDVNRNGLSEAGEVQPLAAWRIVSLSCTYRFDPSHADEIAFSPDGVTFRDATVRPTFDVVLRAQGAPEIKIGYSPIHPFTHSPIHFLMGRSSLLPHSSHDP